MYCANCGKEVSPDSKFCLACGTKVLVAGATSRYCANCGKELPPDSKFCSECGAKFLEADAPAPSEKKKWGQRHPKVFWTLLTVFILAMWIPVGIIYIPRLKRTPVTNIPAPATSSSTSSVPTTAAVSLTETYSNPTYGFSIKYSRDWTKQEGVLGTIVLFQAPKTTPSDTGQKSLNIVIQDLSQNPMTLDDFTKLSLSQLQQAVNNFQVIDSSSTTLAGYPAHRLVYSFAQGQISINTLQVYTIQRNGAFIVTYVALSDKYNDFLPTIQVMIDSITTR